MYTNHILPQRNRNFNFSREFSTFLVIFRYDLLTAFLFYVIFSPACAVMLNKILYMTNYRMQAEEAMRRIDMILTAEVQSETINPKITNSNNITFSDVTFTYENTKKPAISKVSFTAKAGTTTAIVGHSGSGKTTTASLIPRFYDIQEGSIKIGNVDIRDLTHEDLMKKVAFVFQNPKLFKDSLLANICAAKPMASKEEALRAAHLAQCDDILAKFPKGIDTIVGSKGVYLSGGETQRIAIARAMLKNSPILILDEATAFADPDNEAKVQAAFERLSQGKTVIMIAHRLSSVTGVDRVYVLKNGQINQSGKHNELAESGGLYAHMWEEYNKSVNWKVGV